VVAPPAPVAATGDGAGWLAPDVRAALAGAPERPLRVIAHLQPEPTGAWSAPEDAGRAGSAAGGEAAVRARQDAFGAASAGLLADLTSGRLPGHVDSVRPLWSAAAIALTADGPAIRALAERPEVWFVERDAAVTVVRPEQVATAPAAGPPGGTEPQWNIRAVQADDVWGRLGITGAGVTVAVVDTGVDYHHPALQQRYRGYVPGATVPNNDGNWWCKSVDFLCGRGTLYPGDGYGHGSHVAGTVLGAGGVGVAPGAWWIAARVCPSDQCYASWIVEGLQWLLDLGPELRPDVVNMSLECESPCQQLLYKGPVDALAAGGVVVVAATGNRSGTVSAPALYDSAIGVGAVGPDGVVWENDVDNQGSGFGRSLSGQPKPEVVAPGTGITSTLPSGGYGRMTGTSMATPHVSGVAALLLEARPELSPDEVREILQRTATHLAPVVPDRESGWGLVNAYGAVASVMDVGSLRGRVLRSPGDRPIGWARVTVAEQDRDPMATVDVAPDGGFAVDLPPGEYVLIVSAFGYRHLILQPVTVRTGETTALGDLLLELDTPLGTFQGRLLDAQTGAPLEGDILLEGIPYPPIHADERFGFSPQLPAMTYAIRIERFGYRVQRHSIKVTAGPVATERVYHLEPVPKILLVDGDAWAYTGAVESFRASLERLGYLAHERLVTNTASGAGMPGGPPSATEMANYDIVIWSSALSGPALVRGAQALSDYLRAGGRLFLSGQDALCTDAGSDNDGLPCHRRSRRHPYVEDQLFLRVVADDSGSRTVIGRPDGPLAGLTLTLNGPDSMDNQRMTDVIDLADPLHARLIADYGGAGGGAGALIDTCVDHRAVALGFGFEGIAGAAGRDEVMSRILQALMQPRPAFGVYARAGRERLSRPAGATAEFTVTVHSTGTAPGPIEVVVEAADWPTTVWQAGFVQPLPGPLELDPCEAVPVGVRVQVPADAARGDSGTATLLIRAQGQPAATRLTLRTHTPAAVLVVDGDFSEQSQYRYLEALTAAGMAYDVWELGHLNVAAVPPTTATLASYPAVVWFTGRDFLRRQEATLTLASQKSLAEYLRAGGRLLFSSEDFLGTRGQTPYETDRLFSQDFLGVGDFEAYAGAAHAGPLVGGDGSILAGLSGCTLEAQLPEENLSDRLIPGVTARSALLDVYGHAVATEQAAQGFKTLFLAFDAGHLDATCAAALVRRAMDWFSPVSPSRLDLLDGQGAVVPPGRRTYAGGDTLRLRLQLHNDGPRPLDRVQVRWQLPAGAEISSAIPSGWRWDAASRTLSWVGNLPRALRLSDEVRLTLDADLPPHTALETVAEIGGDGFTISRRAAWRVNAPDLGQSSKTVPDAQRVLAYGDRARFVLSVQNNGTRSSSAFTLTDTLPAGLALVDGTVSPASARVERPAASVLVWHGPPLAAQSATVLSYELRLTTRAGGPLHNEAWLVEQSAPPIRLTAAIFARPQLTFPWLGRQLDPDP
jgi:uncharacterized repeat protein (TIGR01451 family)